MSKRAKNIKQTTELLPLPGTGGGSVFSPLPKQEGGVEVEKKGKFKRSGHLTDQILKYNYPKDKSKQISLWDTLGGIKKEEVDKIEKSEIVEGIKLTPSETKVIDCLCKLLHQNSQTVEPKDSNYFTGNLSPQLVEYGEGNTPAPKLSFTLYEITKEYKGGEEVSGKDVENVKKMLTELNSKHFRIKYKEEISGKKGEKLTKEYDTVRRIIDLDLATLTYSVKGIEQYKKTETVVVLHPIFRRQIDSKFILYPNDITQRTIIAYGSHNVSDITIRLRDYLMRLNSSPKMSREINLDRLYYLVAEKWMRESRKTKVKQYLDKALESMLNLGILKSYSITPAKTTGEPKVVFTLNKDFE